MKYRLIICLFAAALFTSSCEKENGPVAGPKYISFNASINAALEYDVKSTKADEGKFAEGTHNMGLWICNPDNSPILPEFANTKVEYTVNPDNSENWKFYSGNKIWEDAIPVDDVRALNIYSYYPYNEQVTDITAIPFTLGTRNYFYSEPVQFTEEYTGADEVEVALVYKPVLTCIEIAVKANVENAIAMDELVLTDTQGENIATRGTYNAITGELAAGTEEMVGSISFQPQELFMLTPDDNTPKVTFIIPKYGNYNGNFKLSFKFNGQAGLSEYTIPAEIAAGTDGDLKEGKKYIITLQLNEAMKFESVEFKTVDDWNDVAIENDIEIK